MLIGLSGGIGSGKSTVARHLHALGAAVIDADQIAREVVAPDSPGLAAVAAAFGNQILSDGALDREALGRIVFSDPAARRQLESITHPLIAQRTRQLVAECGNDAIVVHEIPLLVELHREADYHLTVIVQTSEQVRADRLVQTRGMSRADALARIAAQATDDARRAAADVLLPNESTESDLLSAVDELWASRIVPFADLLSARRAAARRAPWLTPVSAQLVADAARLAARVASVTAADVRPAGPAAVGDDPAPDVPEVRALVEKCDQALADALTDKGFPPTEPIRAWGFAAGCCDPLRPARIHVRCGAESDAAFESLLDEAAAAPVAGWDFSWFAGRASEARPPWGYQRLLTAAIDKSDSVLDLQTGGGEVLAEAMRAARHLPKRVFATESWAPNLPLARRALADFGGVVVEADDHAELPAGHGAVDLVSSRHPTHNNFAEIARVLRPGGRYLSQQVGAGSVRELTFAMLGPFTATSERTSDQLTQQAQSAGLRPLRVETAAGEMSFADIGAVVVFLRKVPWIVPGFTVEGYRDALWRLHSAIVTDGPFRATSERILLECVKD